MRILHTQWLKTGRQSTSGRIAALRIPLCAVTGGVLLLLAGSQSDAAAPAASKPNILFIFADDQAYHTIHALGNDEIQTPNLDRLFREGTTFTHTYNQGGWNGAVCIASRTMLNTGRYLWHAKQAEKGLNQNWVAKQKMWAQLLHAGGY